MIAIACDDVSKEFPSRHGVVHGLDQVRLEIQRGEFVTVKGASGSGKSTLLLTLGGMQRPSQGRVRLDGSDVYALPPAQRAELRARCVGFVFQLFHLLPYLDTLENVLAGLPPASSPTRFRATALDLLQQLGLGDRAHHHPATLSAGERQRVALARALLKKPPVILADEPTGNLDPANAAQVFQHLAAFQREGGTVVVVTHGPDADRFASRQFILERGRLTEAHAHAQAPKPL
ncbi:MAG: ABC transporter ATP-binding protein [Verrucomicrobiales bacterium]|nr:ABC transporter ATP-binding protein [Verrucomicrobiales bacterium]